MLAVDLVGFARGTHDIQRGHVAPKVFQCTKSSECFATNEGRLSTLAVPGGLPRILHDSRRACRLMARPVGLLALFSAVLYFIRICSEIALQAD